MTLSDTLTVTLPFFFLLYVSPFPLTDESSHPTFFISSSYSCNIEVWSPVPTDTCTTQLLHLSLRKYCRRGVCKSQRKSKFTVKLYFLEMADSTPMKSYHHGCLNISYTKMMPRHASVEGGPSESLSTT